MIDLKIFLSSTYVDLASVRKEIQKWLKGLFGAELIVMETFGSDAAPPDISSVRRVRECNLFVGIYANRYGTIDIHTGKSITELELDEAKASISSGVLNNILLFVIDQNSEWLNEFKEKSPEAIAGLTRLKEKASLHTCTPFRARDDLLYLVMCSVYGQISQLMKSLPLKMRKPILPKSKVLRRPIGMEYLSIEHREYLFGRDVELSYLLALIEDNPIVLLLGESGIGKTSMIHAGLIPIASKQGWRIVPTRPLGLPCTDICRTLLATIYEGRPTFTGSLIPLLGEIVGAIKGQNLLLIIDQFEDILMSRDNWEVQNLISDLRTFRDLSPQTVRILLSYRADLEGRIGQYWQNISGSPTGLPRLYLKGVSIDSAWQSLEKTSAALGVSLELKEPAKERIRRDLLAASNALGFTEVYPPYIQMTADHFFTTSHKNKYSLEAYRKAGGMDGIIAGYLGHLLKYAQDTQGNIKSILISLVRSYGVKAQKELKEIAADVGLNERDCEQALEQLVDLRLVRIIPPYYEISHDFIARRIADELVGIEELEFKRFRELLTSKAAAFRITHSLLSTEEQLILYKHRKRLVPTQEETHLLLTTWVHNGGPGLYWLLAIEAKKLITWLRAEEAKEIIGREAKASAILLRHKLGQMPLSEKDYQAFQGYQLSEELAILIEKASADLPINLIVYGLRHKREEVREACISALIKRSKIGNWDWVKPLRNSTSVPLQNAYNELVLRSQVPIPEPSQEIDRYLKEFKLLKLLSYTDSPDKAKTLYNSIQKLRPKERFVTLAQSLLAMKQGRYKPLLQKAKRLSRNKANIILRTPRCLPSLVVFNELIKTYSQWNNLESGRYDRNALNAKARVLSSTIHDLTIPHYLPILRECFKKIRLTSSSREIVLALLKFGSKSDLKLILDRIANHDGPIDYWNHTELGRAAGINIQMSSKGIPPFLKTLIVKREFRGYLDPSERHKIGRRELLPLIGSDNRALYIRIIAHAAIGAATKDDIKELVILSNHQYGLVARGAALKLARLLGPDSLKVLSDNIENAVQSGHPNSCAEALRHAEMSLYGVGYSN